MVRTRLSGFGLLNDPRLNKGTAFSERERDAFELHGLLPPHVGTLEEQIVRRKRAFDSLTTAFGRYSFLRDLQDINETLFYALLIRYIRTLLPVVYTPTVGEGCQRFSEIWRRPRGLFLSYPNQQRMAHILAHPRYNEVQCIVVSDGERILGLGDQGAGGMGIPIGKMALYTALGGIHPRACLPVLLDAGTDNEERLADPLYIGWRHRRVRGAEYDDFVESFVAAVERRWPHVLLQWEDFAGANAGRLLARYRERLCTFNDDIQGTGAAALATVLSAVRMAGSELRQQRFAIVGFGSAGLGIAGMLRSALVGEGLSAAAAESRIFALDRAGLLVEGMSGLQPGQSAFARRREEVKGWKTEADGGIGLAEVAGKAGITALIGVAGQAGVFTENAVRCVSANAARPILLPLSNPTSRSEATPEDLLRWSGGRAIVGTGSPFPPAEYGGRRIPIDQTNNAYIFPGLALGAVAVAARRVSDGMIMAAARALAAIAAAAPSAESSLLPPLEQARALSREVGAAVARQAIAEGLSDRTEEGVDGAIASQQWEPEYLNYEREPQPV
ncbi:MAG: NAD-dependent malic enzyme [Terriglobales bacterium]